MTRSQDNPSVQELFLSELVAEPNRYHLYISHACPFSHRVHLVQSLLGLEDALDVTSVGGGRPPPTTRAGSSTSTTRTRCTKT
ncbi:hypothetical protein [Pseudomonas soli]|uniref:hypothetical protein n=1 Tax=Pseudomonas soli TaxID=1306993 RepID=UPI00345DBB9A